MQIQRLTGPKSSLELTLTSPVLQVSKHTFVTHLWKKTGNKYDCTIYLESTRDPGEKNEAIGHWIGSLPIQFLTLGFEEQEPNNKEEQLDIEVNVTKFHIVQELIPDNILAMLYERYIDRACQQYNLTSELVTNKETKIGPNNKKGIPES